MRSARERMERDCTHNQALMNHFAESDVGCAGCVVDGGALSPHERGLRQRNCDYSLALERTVSENPS